MTNKLTQLYSLPLHELPVVVIDLETTGLRPQVDTICEIGAVRLQAGKITDEYATLVNPQKKMAQKVIDIHHLKDEDLYDAPLLQDVLPSFLSFIGSSAISAHNAGFDVGFLYKPVKSWGINLYQRPILDTAMLSRKLLKKQKSYSLSALAETFELPSTHFHQALEDAKTTAHLLTHLFKEANEKGLHTLAELESQYPFSGHPAPLKKQSPDEQQFWTAIHHKLDLHIRYRNHNGEVNERRITPEWFHPPYLKAFCHLRQERRSFRTDRIETYNFLPLPPRK